MFLTAVHAALAGLSWGQWDSSPVLAWTVYQPLVWLQAMGYSAIEGPAADGWADITQGGLLIVSTVWACTWTAVTAAIRNLMISSVVSRVCRMPDPN